MKKLIALIKSVGKSNQELADEVEETLKSKGVLTDDKLKDDPEYQELQVHFFRKNPKYPNNKPNQ